MEKKGEKKEEEASAAVLPRRSVAAKLVPSVEQRRSSASSRYRSRARMPSHTSPSYAAIFNPFCYAFTFAPT